MTRSDLLFLSGASVTAAAGVMVMTSVMAAAPALFYAAFPLGALGLVAAAAGYMKEDALMRHGDGLESSSGFFQATRRATSRAPGPEGARDDHQRRKGS
ncbi:MAG: hypothetical protein KGI26_03945 [Thaumarchaeota archaeon]|nr:hypothetical protein [Nitrososphaerota archaeon]